MDKMNRLNVQSVISKIESIIQRDEGKRGIKDLFLPEGELFRSAQELIDSNKVVIITGFPCLLDYPVHTETDGPLGAVALAKTLLLMDKTVAILTDECNEEVLLSCVAGASFSPSMLSEFTLESFPHLSEFSEKDSLRLERYHLDYDLLIAIERAGPNCDGFYRTMRNRDMTHLIAPLENIIFAEVDDDLEKINDNMRSIGIGDGGNEVGMGKVYDKIIDSTIPNARDIACNIATDHLIVASVSNWGGYALCAASAVLYAVKDYDIADNSHQNSTVFDTTTAYNQQLVIDNITTTIRSFLPTNEEEYSKCERMIQAGARDGVTGMNECTVDGMEFSETLRILDELRNILNE